MYEEFEAQAQMGGTLSVINVNGSMAVCLPDELVYITEEQAMKFFGLEDTPTGTRDFLDRLAKVRLTKELNIPEEDVDFEEIQGYLDFLVSLARKLVQQEK